MDLNKETTKKILKMITFALVLFFLLQNFVTLKNMFLNMLQTLSPFLYGAGLAFILNIPMRSLEKTFLKKKDAKNKKSKISRTMSIILSLLILIIIISLVIKLVIPQLISVLIMFARNLPGMAYNIKEWALDLTEQYPDVSSQIANIEVNWDQILGDVMNFTKNFAGNLVTSSIGFISSLVGGIFDGIIAIVFAIYILISKEQLSEQLKKILRAYLPEEKANYLLEIGRLSKNTFANFITGQCTEAVILGTLCFLGMLLLRLPYAATIAVLVGVTAIMPVVGAYIGAIVGAILILSVSPTKAILFIVFLIILQQIETNGIYPKVVGNSVGLPGIWVLVAVLVRGKFRWYDRTFNWTSNCCSFVCSFA